MAVIKVGVSAWTEKTLIASGWYPRGAHSAAARLSYYASRFPIAEIDSTYYALPTRQQSEAWVERTPDDFTFDLKAYAPLTAHYTDPQRLPRDLFRALPAELQQKQRVYPRDFPDEIMQEIVTRFRDALEPLRQSGKLGLVLFQYPVWFVYSPKSLAALARIKSLLPGWRAAVEFRNRTWLSDRHALKTLQFLKRHGLTYTCVDEPQGFASSVPPIATATNRLALLRMHGRNSKAWNATTKSAADRMSYLYSDDELYEWVPAITDMAEHTDEVHVVMNNCHEDFAVRNAARLTEILSELRMTSGFAQSRERGNHPKWHL